MPAIRPPRATISIEMSATTDSRRLDRKLTAGVFLLTLLVYAWFFGGTGWNQNSSFALTRAIVEQGTIRIDSFRHLTEDIAHVGGHWYSNKTPGTALLAVMPYFAIHRLERIAGIDPSAPMVFARNMYLCTVAVCGVAGAFIAAALFGYGRKAGLPRRFSLAVAFLIAFGTPVFAYSTILFVHVPNAAFVLAAFLMVWAGNDDRAAVAAGFLGGWAALTNYQCVPYIAFLFLFTFRGERPMRRTILCATGAALPVAVLAWYQFSAFGALFTNPITENERFVTRTAWLGMIQPPRLDALWGITFSRYRGLFFLSPILLLAFPGFVAMWRRGEKRASVFLILSFALFFGFNATFNGWRGGNGIGPRYLVPVVPFLGVLMLHARSAPRVFWWIAGAISVLLNFAAAAVDPQPFEHVLDPLGEHILPVLFTGRGDIARLPWLAAGHTSVNIDSFNVGEFVFGSGSLLSLAPLLLLTVCGISGLLYLARDPGGA